MIGVATKGFKENVPRKMMGLIHAFFQFGRSSKLQNELHYKLGIYFLNFEYRTYNPTGTMFFQGSCPPSSLINARKIITEFFSNISNHISEKDFLIAKKSYVYNLLREEGDITLLSIRRSYPLFWGANKQIVEELDNYNYQLFLKDVKENIISEPVFVEMQPPQ